MDNSRFLKSNIFLLAGTSPFDMTASVKSPSGLSELCDVVSLDDNHYSIKFVPKEMGIHTVSVKHKDMHIPGKTSQVTGMEQWMADFYQLLVNELGF